MNIYDEWKEYSENKTLIFHVDVNSAFLSWSAVKRLKEDPGAVDLRTIASAVGGDKKTRHGIITAKSIPAKKYGIVTGEPVVKALQKCPSLVLVSGDYQSYHEYSHAFIEILKSYTPLVEQVSVDEAFLDMTGFENIYGKYATSECPYPICLAKRIKDEIRDSLGFTVNVGISSNKLLAKMASDFTKPDRIHTLFLSEIRQKMWPLDIGDLYGCGKSSAARLRSFGIKTIGDAARSQVELLCSYMGDNAGTYIFESCNGHGSSNVHISRDEAKSYSNETTVSEDITADNFDAKIPSAIRWLSESVASRLRADGVFANTIGVSAKTETFRRFSRQMTIDDSTSQTETIYFFAMQLIKELLFGYKGSSSKSLEGLFSKGFSIRLIGVSATGLDHGEYKQMNLFDMGSLGSTNPGTENAPSILNKTLFGSNSEKERKLNAMTDQIRSTYGKKALLTGEALLNKQNNDHKKDKEAKDKEAKEVET